MRAQLITFLETALAGATGGAIFSALKLPAPWLSGSMLGVVALMLCGRKAYLPGPLRDFGMLLAGVVMGSAITPEMLTALERYPVSLTSLVLTTVAVTLGGAYVLHRGYGWRRDDALLASLPGAMSAVVAVSVELRADVLRILTVQTFRMFILVALLPSLITGAFGSIVPPEAKAVAPGGFAMVMALSLIISWGCERGGILAPYLIGGMIAAGLTHASDLIPGAPPPVLADLSMGLIGLFAASRLANFSAAAMKAHFMPGLVLFVVTMAIALIGALAAVALTTTPLAEALIAFAPGGLEAMVVLGLALGLDPLYVSSHHIARFLLITALVPFMGKLLFKDRRDQ